jgi:flagella basal body P-ring formation protein FlgA
MKALIKSVPPLVALLLFSGCSTHDDELTAGETPYAGSLYVKVAQNVKKGAVLRQYDLQEFEGSAFNTPALAVRSAAEGVGRKAKHELRLGQWLSETDFEPVSQPRAPLVAYASHNINKGESLSRQNVIFVFKHAKTMMPSGAAYGTGVIGLPATHDIPKGKVIRFADLLE